MPPDLQQKRIGANSCDERRQACADVDSPGRRQDTFHQQARCPAAWRPEYGCSAANAHEGFKQVWFPQELIRKSTTASFRPAQSGWGVRRVAAEQFDPGTRPYCRQSIALTG
jgi:hypothetical protein